MTTQAATATWPEGVIARYLTLVGATVDLAHRDETQDGKKKATFATCTGCRAVTAQPWADSFPNHHRPGRTEFQNQDKGDRAARTWAQTHAETCRALPVPIAPAMPPEPQVEPQPKRHLWLPTRRSKGA